MSAENEFDEDDLSEYLSIYLDETEEQLDDLVETMLILEQDPSDNDSLVVAFRLLHSIKGAAGMMGFDQITALTHHLETRFERLRSGRIELDRTTTNLTLRCIDFLRQCNERLRSSEPLSSPDDLLSELRSMEDSTIEQLNREEIQQSPDPDIADLLEPSSVATESKDADIEKVDEDEKVLPNESYDVDDPNYRLPDLGTDYHVVVFFDPHIQLMDLKAEAIARLMGEIGDVLATRPEMDELDQLDANGQFDVIVNTTQSPDQIIATALISGIARAEVRVPREPDLDPIAVGHAEADKSSQPQAETAGSTSDAANDPQAIETDSGDESSEPSTPIVATAKPGETMRVDIDRLDQLMNLAGELVVNRAQFAQVTEEIQPYLRRGTQAARIRELSETLGRTIEKLKAQATETDHGQGALCRGDSWRREIQELETGLETLSQQTEIWEQGRRAVGRLNEAFDQLSRVSDKLQRSVLSTRMVPIGPLFSRFRRVVRDLSQSREKEVELVVDGESTELDKRMIDQLGDPLVHLVRNAIDHGLESTEERIAAGKPERGKIVLTASHRGNHVCITIADDGHGIDPQRIAARMLDRGLASHAEIAVMNEEEIIAAIFRPGFSTAQKVTDVSGRGVGMDIVKSTIEQLGGSIEINSQVGRGTTFTLMLPLTLAIIGSLLFRIGSAIFGVAKEDVREIVSIMASSVVTVGNRRTIEFRDGFIPLLEITQLFPWDAQILDLAPELSEQVGNTDTSPQRVLEVAILNVGDRMVGLRVDQAIGSQDVVIKSLTENFVPIPGISGASILGNGSVALMLDVATLEAWQ